MGHNLSKQLINVILFLNMLSCLLPDTELVYLCSIWIIYIQKEMHMEHIVSCPNINCGI